jgi:glutamate--cysteine ligase
VSVAETAPQPLRRDQLVDYFVRALRPGGTTIGTEQEKFGIALDGDRLSPIDYPNHVKPLLEAMIERFGWKEGDDRGVNGEIVMLQRDGASITLEPGGQFELSGAPLPTVHHTCAEFTQHYEELHSIAKPMGIAFLAAGFHPFATLDEINWMPKGRYEVMRNYLPTRGERALDMMSRTCTVQANFDYSDEAECGRRLKTALAVSPILTALFANSPIIEGRANSIASNRSNVWEYVDPDRCGIPPFLVEEPFSFERYIDWALATPMFFITRRVAGEYRYIAHHGTFGAYMRDGIEHEGVRYDPTWADWELHLSTLFPEVRIKPFIEIRGTDSISSRFVCSLPALVKGLLYDDAACEEARELMGSRDHEERMDLWRRARRDGLKDPEVHPLAAKLLSLSRSALERTPVLDSRGRSEARFLESLDDVIDRRMTPGDFVLEEARQLVGGDFDGRTPEGRAALVRAFHFAGAMPD